MNCASPLGQAQFIVVVFTEGIRNTQVAQQGQVDKDKIG
jgi:hypothetical protein